MSPAPPLPHETFAGIPSLFFIVFFLARTVRVGVSTDFAGVEMPDTSGLGVACVPARMRKKYRSLVMLPARHAPERLRMPVPKALPSTSSGQSRSQPLQWILRRRTTNTLEYKSTNAAIGHGHLSP